MKKFFYCCDENSEMGKKLATYVNKCGEAEETAQAFAKKYGAVSYVESPLGMCGGVELLIFETGTVDDGFGNQRVICDADTNLWKPFKMEGQDGAYEVNITDEENERITNDLKDALALIRFGWWKRTMAKIRLWWRGKMNPYTEAMLVEKERQDLPYVTIEELMDILKPKPIYAPDGHQLPFALHETPSIFMYLGKWWLGLSFQSEATGLTEADEKKFYRSRMACLNTMDD